MATPQLRFKEFDGDWNTVNLKDCIASIDSGWSPQCESYPANFSQWGVLKTTSVDWSGFQEKANKKLPEQFEPRLEIEVKPYDILVTRAGPTERVGVVSVVPHNVREKLLISDKLIRIKSNRDNDPNFLGISLSSFKCQNQLQSKTSGLAKSQTNISQRILLDVALQTPPKEEQTKIASFLSVVDEKISQLTRKHELLSQYKQGMMQKLFSQQIRFKAEDGSEFGEWEYTTLGEVVDFSNGKRIPLSEGERQKRQGNYRYYGASGVIDYVDDYIFDGQYILIGEDGANILTRSLPLAFVVEGKFWVNNHAHIFQSKKGNNLFLATYLESLNYEKFNSGTAQPKLNMENLKKVPVIDPCLEEQTKIAHFLSAIDQKIEVVAQQIEQAKQWKKGLLQQMFV